MAEEHYKPIHKLTINGEVTDLNTYVNAERSNRFKAAKIKKDETERVIMACYEQLKGITIDYPVDVYIHWVVKNRRKDPDNIAFAKKFILDGLVKSGVLVQDSQKYIMSFADTFEVDKDNTRVVVRLVKS